MKKELVIVTKATRKNLQLAEEFNIWGFIVAGKEGAWDGPFRNHAQRFRGDGEMSPVWRSVDLLEKMGLMSFIPHLYPNAGSAEGPLHSLGEVSLGAEPEEEELRTAACAAARAMLQPEQPDSAYLAGGYELLVPALNWMVDVQVRGVVRLRYRPRTSATAKWHRDLVEKAPGWVRSYNDLRVNALAARPAQVEWRAWNA